MSQGCLKFLKNNAVTFYPGCKFQKIRKCRVLLTSVVTLTQSFTYAQTISNFAQCEELRRCISMFFQTFDVGPAPLDVNSIRELLVSKLSYCVRCDVFRQLRPRHWRPCPTTLASPTRGRSVEAKGRDDSGGNNRPCSSASVHRDGAVLPRTADHFEAFTVTVLAA